MVYDLIVIGGGAAGFFTAINCAEFNQGMKIGILEKGNEVLSKVKISGGGRCNVTHAEFDPKELTAYYPRGKKELLGSFHTFMTGDIMQWFEDRGVPLKIEEDGRVFPKSNTSQSIIDCFLSLVEKYTISVFKKHAVKTMVFENGIWRLNTATASFSAKKVMIASGSSPKMWEMIRQLGHKTLLPVPSLFTFNIKDTRISSIPGVVAKQTQVKVIGTSLQSTGPILITHSGMSAPAILKLSSYGAIELAKLNYKFDILINFINQSYEDALEELVNLKQKSSKKTIFNTTYFDIPKRLWQQLVLESGISNELRWTDVSKAQLISLSKQLTNAVFSVTGKSTFKEEFVTAGGVDLREVNFKTFQSKLYNSLYFAGEVLNVDAVTGGFNFQNAWTGAYIAAKHITK